MYNEKRKKEYMEEIVLQSYPKFNKTEQYEKILGKDIGEMDHEEFLRLIQWLKYTNKSTLRTQVSEFQKYRDWCVDKGYARNCEPLSSKEKELSVFKVQRYITDMEIKEGIEHLENPCDKVLLLGITEGVCRKGDNFFLFFQLSPDCLCHDKSGYYIYRDGIQTEISELLYKYCIESAKCYKKITYNRKDDWKHQEYVIKDSKNTTIGEIKNFASAMRARIRKAKKKLNWENVDLFLCYKLSILHSMCEMNKRTIDELFDEKEYLKRYEGRFGEISPVQKSDLVYEYKRAFPFDDFEEERINFKEQEEIIKINCKKLDYEEIHHQNIKLGEAGEKFIFEREKKRVEKYNLGKDKKVIWASKEYGDGLGYDILSYDANGNKKLIEVKTTDGRKDTPFYITNNELQKSIEEEKCFYLYRVYNYDTVNENGGILVYKGSLEEYCKTPILYKIEIME